MTESPSKKINITVKTASGSKYEIQVETTVTIGELKKLLEEKSQVAAEQQRLIYSGKVLRDELTLEDYCNNLIHFIL
jgi:ubiquilin